MTIVELNPPAVEPVTLAEVKAQLRLETGDEDVLLASLIRTARQHLERQAGLALISRVFRLYRDEWPEGAVMSIPLGPVSAIEAVTVYDGEGTPATVALAGHVLDGASSPARLVLATRPDPGRAINGIEIDFTAGFGPTGADVPDTLKRAMLLHVAHMFEFRAAIAPGDQPAGIPAGYDRLIAPYCRRSL